MKIRRVTQTQARVEKIRRSRVLLLEKSELLSKPNVSRILHQAKSIASVYRFKSMETGSLPIRFIGVTNRREQKCYQSKVLVLLAIRESLPLESYLIFHAFFPHFNEPRQKRNDPILFARIDKKRIPRVADKAFDCHKENDHRTC